MLFYTNQRSVWRDHTARNKYPEETIKLILDTARKLFIEKGYEQTSLQDIINGTKPSKVRDHPTLNGLKKLQEIFRSSLRNSNQSMLMEIIPYLLNNLQFLTIQIQFGSAILRFALPLYLLRETGSSTLFWFCHSLLFPAHDCAVSAGRCISRPGQQA